MRAVNQIILALLINSSVYAEERAVGYGFAPEKWQTMICLPDDPEKTLVDHEGRLLYGFREGNYFNLRLSLEIDPESLVIGQDLIQARTPVVRTKRSAPGLELIEHAFAVPVERKTQEGVQRIDAGRVLTGWARPEGAVNPLLATGAVHSEGSVRVALPVIPNSKCCIAVALCEGLWTASGKRIVDLSVEGAETQTVDPAASFGKNRVGILWFNAQDADGDGRIVVASEARCGNALLNGIWRFPAGENPDATSLISGKLDHAADSCWFPADRRSAVSRNDVIRVDVRNISDAPKEIRPMLVADALIPVQVDLNTQTLRTGNHEQIGSSLRMVGVETNRRQRIVSLQPLTLAPGEFVRIELERAIGSPPALTASEKDRLGQACAWWAQAAVPYDRIAVPDVQIQALVDACIRTIWQSREKIDGKPVMYPGPTCYRNLWIIDSAFLLETIAMLGKEDEARAGLRLILERQKADGRFEEIDCAYKENGIVLWSCIRHAELTQDLTWLRSVWPDMIRTVAQIRKLREETLLNETPLDDGLMPAGFIDGGLASRDLPEYSNSYWNLIGLKAAIRAAHLLGKIDFAKQWEAEYAAFREAFERAAVRDSRMDSFGNRYLPILMGDAGSISPQKGQWTFLHAVHPGELFSDDDPILEGNLAMLEATEQQGMVVDSGWMEDGIWTYFAGFYGHAWLWSGNPGKAVNALYAMANHAAPTLVWREEQPVTGQSYRSVGDMPHSWASAEFIRLTVHLLALERGDELHLLEGLPEEWMKPGMETRLNGILTRFGPLTMAVKISADGRSARICVNKLAYPCEEFSFILAKKQYV